MLERIMNTLADDEVYSETEEIPPSNEVVNSVMMFDDVSCERQHNIRKYFATGRPCGVDAFYLCQTYCEVPKQFICVVILIYKCF